MEHDLWRWTAVDLARGIRRRQVSSREAVDSIVSRIGDVNPRLNALVEDTVEESYEMADAADRAVAAGEPLGPLAGVPVSIKVNTDQAGHATTNGVAAFKDEIARDDAPPVRKLREAGAVFVGRSNAPSFSFRWFTANDLHGTTRNPWTAERTPGGSSGGACAAVASGMGPIAQANDIGGSIRYSAYACGVVGLRPTVGRVPSWYGPTDRDESLAVQSVLVQGPQTRTVADAGLALEAMTGTDPRDPVAVPAPSASAMHPLERPQRVGLLRDVGVATPAAAVNEALETAAGWLAAAGYAVEEIELPLLEEAYRLWYLLCLEEFRPMMPLAHQLADEDMKTAAAHFYAIAEDWWGSAPALEDYINGYARRGTLIGRLQAFLEEIPLVLLPVSAEPAFELDADLLSLDRARSVVAAQWSMMAIPILGFPALSVPTGVADGIPMGVQLLGRRFREDTILDAAAIIEAQAGVLTPIDPMP